MIKVAVECPGNAGLIYTLIYEHITPTWEVTSSSASDTVELTAPADEYADLRPVIDELIALAWEGQITGFTIGKGVAL